MADIRIRDLPTASPPVATDFVPIDNGTTRKTDIQTLVETGRPAASQAEAEAGTNPTKVMTPLTTKQAVTSYGLLKANNLNDLADAASARTNLGLGTAATANTGDFATAAQGVLADGALQRSGGTMTGAIIGDDGGTHRSSKWFFNDVRDQGADDTGSANSSAAFTAAKGISPSIRVKTGTYKLDAAYNLSTGVYDFGHNVFLKKPDNSQSDATLNGIQISGYTDKGNEIAERSGGIVITPLVKFKADSSSISGAGDETYFQNNVLWYQRTATAVGNAYAGGANIYAGFMNYGATGPASGSSSIVGLRYNVHDVQAEATGRSEHTAISSGIIAMAGKTQNKSNFYHDFVVSGPDTVQESFLASVSMTSKKLHSGLTLDADHNGAYVFVAETNPQMGGFDSPLLTSYTMHSGGIITGWAGPTTATDGYHASATSAYQRALRIGGSGGVWSSFNSHSKFDIALSLTDFVNTGIEIFTAHPAGSSPRAIQVFEDAGTTLLGINTISGTHKLHVGNTSGQFDNNARLYPTGHATSERAALLFGDWVVGQDRQGNGTKDLFAFDSNAGLNRFVIDTSGNVSFPAATGTLTIGSSQVLTTRRTGWAAATGTATRTTFATGTVTTTQLAERVKALIDDLISHGLIGA